MNQRTITQNRIFSIKLAKKLVFSLVFMLIFEIFLFPAPIAWASENDNSTNQRENNVNNPNPENLNEDKENDKDGKISQVAAFENSLPENENLEIAWTTYRTMTAYNSEAAQCDSTPCVTANGFNVCEHGIEDTIAANWLKFGTKVRIPELFGDKIFVVRDRMNTRYQDRVDIWMLEKETAKSFGRRIAKIEILAP